MEKRLGADLSGVKIHTGGESAVAASAVGARAFTVGSDVHFNAGQFAPGTKEGDRLLAHELTHVVQGQRSGIQRKADEQNDAAASDSMHEASVSQPHEEAEQEADAVADSVADNIHRHDDEQNQAAGKSSVSKESPSPKRDDAERREVEGDRPPKIAAKLDGVGLKVWRATTPPPSLASGAAPMDPEVEIDTVKTELASGASAGGNTYTPAEAEALAKTIAPSGKVRKSVLDTKKANCESALKKEWRTQLGSDRAFVGAYAKADTIALRKFGELDGEPDHNYEGGGGAAHKAKFYQQLASTIETEPVPRMNVFGKCDGTVRKAGLRMLGKIIPESVLEPLLHRTAGIDNTWKFSTDQKAVAADCVSSPTFPPSLRSMPHTDLLAKFPSVVKEFWIASGGAYAKSKLIGNLTPPNGGTWFSSGTVSVKPGDAGFAQLMEIGALQPEWFSDGAVKFTISSAGLGAVRENLRKPTCLDGMQSGMFVPKYDLSFFGVTGGGYNEFLAGTVPSANVTKMEIISTSPGLQQAIQAADAQARSGGHGSAMDAMERGQSPNLGQASGVYNQVATRTEQERRNPTRIDGAGQRV
jgi:hypothetical protein